MRRKNSIASGSPSTGGNAPRRFATLILRKKPSRRESSPHTPTGGSYSIKMETAAMEVTKLPTVLRDLVLSYHAPGHAHARMNHEFKELVGGRPWTCWSMLWLNWWGAEHGLTACRELRFLPRAHRRDPPGGRD